MSPAAFSPFLYQILLAAGIGAAIIAASHLLGQRARRNRIKDTPYECGVPGGGIVHARFAVKFYVTAMLFILFDIEVIFLLPWTFVYREFLANHLPVVTPMLVFVGLLVLGLVYEARKGALDWEK